MQRLLTALVFAGLVLGALWFCNLRNPHLLYFRGYETAALAGLLVFILALAKVIESGHLRRAVRIVAAILMAAAILAEYKIRTENQRILNAPAPEERAISRRVILGFRDFATVEKLVRNEIGGIFVSHQNIAGKSFEEVRRAIEGLQRIRREADLPPLIVAADQEGGAVSRLSPLVTRQPPLNRLLGDPKAEEKAYAYGLEQGRQLSDLGINVNFSPVVDLKSAAPPGRFDWHTRIHARAISAVPSEVVALAEPYIRGLGASEVKATLKHFPGLGRVTSDTHHFAASLDTPIEELAQSDWLPFAELAHRTGAWMMLGHVTLSALDADNPASASRDVVEQIVRGRLGFRGVLVTDDMTMGAAYNRGFCASVRGAYEAGVDYLLVAYDAEKYFDLIRCLVAFDGGPP